MKRGDVRSGQWYTKDGLFARQVLSVGELVIYRDFAMSTGEPISTSSSCRLPSFATWCRRTLTPEEIARMRTDDADQRVSDDQDAFRRMFKMAMEASVDQHLHAASDAALLAEIRRRGWLDDAGAGGVPVRPRSTPD
jgi:hypothetical protein